MEQNASGSASSVYKEYVAGLLAGVSSVIIGHPFDTVKVKLQKHNTDVHGIQYKNGLHCAARIFKYEGVIGGDTLPTPLKTQTKIPTCFYKGWTVKDSFNFSMKVKGLYRGATSSFVGMAFESSVLFGMYSQMKMSLLQGRLQSSGPEPLVIIPSAATGGAIISFILCPSELVKCRMQVQGTDSLVPRSNRYAGPVDCAFQTIKADGVRGLFRGGVATLMRESIGNAVFFSVYEYVKHVMQLQLKDASEDRRNLTEMGIGIASGGLAGVAFWCAVLPLDVAKTIIQTDPDNSCSRNPLRVLKSVYSRAGLRGCYAGLGPTVLRAFPANAAAIVTLEFAAKVMGVKHE